MGTTDFQERQFLILVCKIQICCKNMLYVFKDAFSLNCCIFFKSMMSCLIVTNQGWEVEHIDIWLDAWSILLTRCIYCSGSFANPHHTHLPFNICDSEFELCTFWFNTLCSTVCFAQLEYVLTFQAKVRCHLYADAHTACEDEARTCSC